MSKSDAAARKIVSRSEFARSIGRSRARVSQLCQGGMAGVLSDGRIDVELALGWLRQYKSSHRGGWGSGMRARDCSDIAIEAARPTPAAPKLKAGPNSKPRRGAINAAVAADQRCVEARRDGYLQAAREVLATKEVVRLTQFALRCGCNPKQACNLGIWFSSQVTLALKGLEEDDDVFKIPEPDWKRVVGDVDLDVIADEFDALSRIDMSIEGSAEALVREAELDSLCGAVPVKERAK